MPSNSLVVQWLGLSILTARGPRSTPGWRNKIPEATRHSQKYICVCVCVYAEQASLVVQTVKNPPAMGKTWVWFLGWEDPLEEDGNPLQYSGL